MTEINLASFRILAGAIAGQMRNALKVPHPDPIQQEHRKSDWKPLINLVGERHASDFMIMGNVDNMILYKHKDTRRYLNIDAHTGMTYRFVPARTIADFMTKGSEPRYELIPQIDAISYALNAGVLG